MTCHGLCGIRKCLSKPHIVNFALATIGTKPINNFKRKYVALLLALRLRCQRLSRSTCAVCGTRNGPRVYKAGLARLKAMDPAVLKGMLLKT